MAVQIPDPQLVETSTSNGTYFFSYAGNLFFVMFAHVGDPPINTFNLNIWKSTDDGDTWVRIINDSDRKARFFAVTEGPGGILYIVAQPYPTATALHLYSFNMNTDAVATLSTAGPTGYSNELAACALSDGKIRIFYHKTGSGLGFETYDGGWSGFTVIDSDLIVPDWAIKEKTSDRVHLFAVEDLLSASNLYHVSIEPGGSINTFQLLTPEPIGINPGTDTGSPAIADDDSMMVYPHVIQGAVSKMYVFRATPAANPTWAKELVPTNGLSLTTTLPLFGWFIPFAIATGTRLTIVFASNIPASSGLVGAVGRLYETHTDLPYGHWSSPELLFQAPANAVVLSPYVAEISDDQLGIVVATLNLPQFFGTGTKYSSLGLWYSAVDGTLPPPVPTISCGSPAAGNVGEFYSHALPVSWGTQFKTLSITAGALPPGLALSNDGVISGEPSIPGSFPFTVKITDSLLQTAEVSCSITINDVEAEGGENVAY